MNYQGQGSERYMGGVAVIGEPRRQGVDSPYGDNYIPQVWQNVDHMKKRALFNSESYGGFWKNYFPSGTYAGQIRLEPGQWPPYGQAPYSMPVIYQEGSQECGPDKPCPFSGASNEGVIVMQNGIPTRRGMCVRGKCDLPVGMTQQGGTAHRDAFGNVVWSNSQITAPNTDPYSYHQGLWKYFP